MLHDVSAATLVHAAQTAPFCSDRPGWWLLFPLLWFLVLVAVVVTVARGGWWRHRFEPARSAQSRLAERYAAGEIDETEYRARLAVLKDLR